MRDEIPLENMPYDDKIVLFNDKQDGNDMKLIKKLLCLAAALCILLSLLPTAFAEEGDERFRDKTWE